MQKDWTLSGCFAHFGAKGKNSRWSWSARTPDNKTVVLTLWVDYIQPGQDKTIVYENVGDGSLGWVRRPGNRERLENLRFAMDRCGGLFRVVFVRAKDTAAEPREIAECYPRADLKMRIIPAPINADTWRRQATDR